MFSSFPPYKFILAFIDCTALLFSLAIIRNFGRFGALWPPQAEHPVWFYIGMVSFFVLCLFTFQYNQLYKQNIFLSRAAQLTLILKSMFVNLIALVFMLFFLDYAAFQGEFRYVIIPWVLLATGLIIIFRIMIFRNLYTILTQSQLIQQNVLIVGAGKSGMQVATSFQNDARFDKNMIGFIDDYMDKGNRIVSNYPVLGKTRDVENLVREYAIDLIVIAMSTVSHKRLIEIYEKCLETGVTVKVYSDLVSIVREKVPLEIFNGFHLVGSNKMINSLFFRFLKRASDLFFSLLLLFMLSPFLLLIALAIKINSKGPVFYKQTRIGKHGKPFTFYKFRSMVINNDDSLHRLYVQDFIQNNKAATENNGKKTYKILDDPRVTRIGKILRATSMDELPQLINVVKGEMSLVGPRPCMPYEWETYEEWHKKRLSVTPGCTGLWQVSGRSAVGFNDMVMLDLFYINNMSPWFDLQLIIKTIPVMLFARGAH